MTTSGKMGEQSSGDSSTQTSKKSNLGKVAELVVAWVLIFSLFFLYIKYCAFTSWKTGALVGISAASLFVLLYVSFVWFRCDAVLFVIHLASHFGLTMVNFFISWMYAQKTAGSYIMVQRAIENGTCGCRSGFNNNETLINDEKIYETAETVITIAHYMSFIPVLMLFLYTVLYEATYTIRRNLSNEVVRASGSYDLKQQIKKRILRGFRNIVSSCFGVSFGVTITLEIAKRDYFSSLKEDFLSDECKTLLETGTGLWIYLGLILFTLVISVFSKKILKYRHAILTKFYTVHGTQIDNRIVVLKVRKDQRSFFYKHDSDCASQEKSSKKTSHLLASFRDFKLRRGKTQESSQHESIDIEEREIVDSDRKVEPNGQSNKKQSYKESSVNIQQPSMKNVPNRVLSSLDELKNKDKGRRTNKEENESSLSSTSSSDSEAENHASTSKSVGPTTKALVHTLKETCGHKKIPSSSSLSLSMEQKIPCATFGSSRGNIQGNWSD